MIFSTVPGRVTDGLPASVLSVGVCLVKGLHSPNRLAAGKCRQPSAQSFDFPKSSDLVLIIPSSGALSQFCPCRQHITIL